MGSLASELIHYSRAPVLLIPTEAPPPSESVRVLVPLDGSGQAEYALFPIIALANASRGQYIKEITLLMACEDRRAMSAATSYLEGVFTSLGRLVAPMIHTRVEVVHARAAGAIVKSVRGSATRRFDMLAMTTHGEGEHGGKLFGGVADYVLSRAEVPTLVVNPRCHYR
jgi:nucleotide-binding universal stress UspA family protein